MEDLYRKIFDFLAVRDTPQKADIIIGFGHFDMNIPRQCCQLYLEGYAGKILYAGGVGAGSADFQNPESIEFLNFTKKNYPQIPEEDIIIEDKSTNTGKNIRYGLETLRFKLPSFNFNYGMESAILVATPARQLRVYLTARMYLMGKSLFNIPPETTYEQNIELFDTKNDNFRNQLIGEMKRIIEYPEKEFCEPTDIPDEVLMAFQTITEK